MVGKRKRYKVLGTDIRLSPRASRMATFVVSRFPRKKRPSRLRKGATIALIGTGTLVLVLTGVSALCAALEENDRVADAEERAAAS